VWRAIANAEEFRHLVQVKLEGAFVAGRSVKGRITAAGYEHLNMEITVERVEPEQLLSYRWHPYAIEPGVDYFDRTDDPGRVPPRRGGGRHRAHGGGVGFRWHSRYAPR